MIGDKIKIRPATMHDKTKIFDWLTNSNLTSSMMGFPDYPDAKIPTWDEFDKDYLNHYFDGSAPLKGRCFIIIEEEIEVGQINYNPIDIDKKMTSLDIWLSDKKYTGRGIGTEAIILLCKYLNEQFGCEKIVMCPSKRNKNAIKSYTKAGFVITNIECDELAKDYSDNIVMIKNVKNVQMII